MAIYEKAITGITDLVSEFITDDDLQAKLDFKVEKLRFELDKELLKSKTTPKVDALVKFMIALRDIILPLFRPLGSVALAGFGAYCVVEGIYLPEYIQVALFGSPLAYGAARGADKKRVEQTKQIQAQYEPELKDDDFDDYG